MATMDTQFVNQLVYDYMAKVDWKLADNFKKQAKVTQKLPPGSPSIVDIFKHFKETSKEIKRKHAHTEEESSPKKAKQNLAPDSSADTKKVGSERETVKVEVKADTKTVEQTKIFIKNIGRKVVYEDIQDKVEQFGKVTKFVNTGRGFCFLVFSSAESANACVSALNNSEIAGKTVQMNINVKNNKKKTEAAPTGKETTEALNGEKVSKPKIKAEADPKSTAEKKVKPEADPKSTAEKKSKKPQVVENFRLFVNNVSRETTQDDLKSAFAAHGTVTETYNPGKGFAFVNFSNEEEAQAAIEALDEKNVCGREIKCYIAKRRFRRAEVKTEKLQ
eukprot:GFUD01126532.1.p1 GENE.GFUD01126532.1~~GFUD01126532.1.p1  ORF type:complete len:333 (-),score=118.37 GFUD01126532.1:61-1059(-)